VAQDTAERAAPPKVEPSIDLGDPEMDSIPPSFAVAGVKGRGGLVGSFRAAIAGVLRTVATQRNMKIHIVAGLMVMIVGMALPLDLGTRVAMLFAVSIVFFAEILNTALEALIDLFVKDFHRLAMLAKDAAAGGVLVFAVTTLFVLAEILWMEWHLVEENLDAVQRSCLFGIPLVGVEAVGLFVIRSKSVQMLRLLLSLLLLAPLLWHSKDPLYASAAFLLVAVAFVARAFYTSKKI
jgi:diacylglycerol kinase (ATP)